MIDRFLQCCELFLAADGELILHLQQQGFICDANGWNFTLPRLHQYLAEQMTEGEVPSYLSFRQQLFNSPINTHLAGKSAEIVIADNMSKVDLSIYRLQRAAGSGVVG